MLTTTGDNHRGGNNNNDNNNSTARSLARPTEKDIIIGKGNVRRHRGNIWFLWYVLRHHEEYSNYTEKEHKTDVLKRIVKQIRHERRRFYDKDENGNWYVVNFDQTNHIGGGNRNVIHRKISRILNRKRVVQGSEEGGAPISNVGMNQSASTPEVNQQSHSYGLRSRHPCTSQTDTTTSEAPRCHQDDVTCWILDDLFEQNGDIMDDVWNTLRDIFCSPFRRPNTSGNKGIVITADSPRGNQPTINTLRWQAYLRQHFVKPQRGIRSSRTSKKTTCYPYGIGSAMGNGYGSVGTPPR